MTRRSNQLGPDALLTEQDGIKEAVNAAEVQRVAQARPQRTTKTADAPEFQPWVRGESAPVPQDRPGIGGVNFVPVRGDETHGQMVTGAALDGRSTRALSEQSLAVIFGGPAILVAGADNAPAAGAARPSLPDFK